MTLFVIVIIGFIIYLIIKSKLPKQTNRREPIYPTYLSDPKMRHPHRDKAVQEIKDWLEGIELTDVIVFDTETNGLYPEESSLLSIGAIRYSWDPYEKLKEKARFERCYYPKEPFNERAIMVNGLTKEKIAELRGDATYPEHFLDDYLSLKEFCEGSRLIAGHNVSFDVGFVPFLKNRRKLDTMKSNADVVCVEWMDSKEDWKWPSLEETARFYGVPFNEDDAHGALYDAMIAGEILKRMLDRAGVMVQIV